ncbi:MAG: flagellar export protein FliJ [Lachnospiraceae bacterium]|jgi:flagellar FliJ protein|nr:flagellar export protein FliJ [Lachnospiraceae bacterium]
MAKFQFRMQSVLNLKIRLEEQQKNAFAAAKKRLDEEIENLSKLYKRKEGYEEEGRRMRAETLSVNDILENENAIVRMKEYIDEQTKRVMECEKQLEEERVKMVEMMQERKTYERLREKAFEQFLEDEKHEEGVINDEHNSFVYGTGR